MTKLCILYLKNKKDSFLEIRFYTRHRFKVHRSCNWDVIDKSYLSLYLLKFDTVAIKNSHHLLLLYHIVSVLSVASRSKLNVLRRDSRERIKLRPIFRLHNPLFWKKLDISALPMRVNAYQQRERSPQSPMSYLPSSIRSFMKRYILAKMAPPSPASLMRFDLRSPLPLPPASSQPCCESSSIKVYIQ